MSLAVKYSCSTTTVVLRLHRYVLPYMHVAKWTGCSLIWCNCIVKYVHVQLVVFLCQTHTAGPESNALYISIQLNITQKSSSVVHIQGPTIEMYEGPQELGIKL